MLGTPVDTIIATEDREVFARKLAEVNEKVAPSACAATVDEAVAVANQIGYVRESERVIEIVYMCGDFQVCMSVCFIECICLYLLSSIFLCNSNRVSVPLFDRDL